MTAPPPPLQLPAPYSTQETASSAASFVDFEPRLECLLDLCASSQVQSNSGRDRLARYFWNLVEAVQWDETFIASQAAIYKLEPIAALK